MVLIVHVPKVNVLPKLTREKNRSEKQRLPVYIPDLNLGALHKHLQVNQADDDSFSCQSHPIYHYSHQIRNIFEFTLFHLIFDFLKVEVK